MPDSATIDHDPHAEARDHLARYLAQFPNEQAGLAALTDQLLNDAGDVFARSNMRGHITTSAIVYDPCADAVLMIHHAALDRWLQPGGHHEGAQPLQASAAREAAEETGVAPLDIWPHGPFRDLPLDIDSHAIPERPAKGESAHVHHDYIYLFSADSRTALRPDAAEVTAARWVPRAEFAVMPEARFARLAAKIASLRKPTAPSA
ncbi:NUDIX hydrolase [Roseateles sp. LYH14W]|uniref:NUDIX hydrolase n=1 Tax=Pelomonas parva TaxID=3299032 RepID=A0ABW7EWB1_9BURK